MAGFAAKIASWSEKAERDMLPVFQRAVILLAQEMTRTKEDGGALPKITGNLMRSLLAQIAVMPNVKPEGDDGDGNFFGSDVGAVVAQSLLGSEIYLGFQANYARRRNSGYVGTRAEGSTWEERGAFFVERAVKLWPQCVKQAVQDVKNGVGV